MIDSVGPAHETAGRGRGDDGAVILFTASDVVHGIEAFRAVLATSIEMGQERLATVHADLTE